MKVLLKSKEELIEEGYKVSGWSMMGNKSVLGVDHVKLLGTIIEVAKIKDNYKQYIADGKGLLWLNTHVKEIIVEDEEVEDNVYHLKNTNEGSERIAAEMRELLDDNGLEFCEKIAMLECLKYDLIGEL